MKRTHRHIERRTSHRSGNSGGDDDDDDDNDTNKNGSKTSNHDDDDVIDQEQTTKKRKSLQRKREREVMRRSFLNDAYENLEKTVYQLDPSVRVAQPQSQRRRRNSSRLFITTIPNRPALLHHAAHLVETMHRDQQMWRQKIERAIEEQNHRQDCVAEDNGENVATATLSPTQDHHHNDQQEDQVRSNLLQELPASSNRSVARLPIGGSNSTVGPLIGGLAVSGLSSIAANMQSSRNLMLLQSYNEMQNSALLRDMAMIRVNQASLVSSNPRLILDVSNWANWTARSRLQPPPPPMSLQSLLNIGAPPLSSQGLGLPLLQSWNAAGGVSGVVGRRTSWLGDRVSGEAKSGDDENADSRLGGA